MNAIYLHPTNGFTFLENVPEKPNEDNYPNYQGYRYDLDLYERALAETIQNRLVIGNPEVIEGVRMANGLTFTLGPIIPWPATYKIEFVNANDYLAGAQKKVVILSPPKEEHPGREPNQLKPSLNNAHNFTEGSEPVNSSMSEEIELLSDAGKAWERENEHHPSGINPHAFILGYKAAKSEPVVSQEELWREVNNMAFYTCSDLDTDIEKLMKHFIISRKPID